MNKNPLIELILSPEVLISFLKFKICLSLLNTARGSHERAKF